MFAHLEKIDFFFDRIGANNVTTERASHSNHTGWLATDHATW